MKHKKAMRALRELQVVQPVLPPQTVAERAAAILDRAGLEQVDLTRYLQERGYADAALARAMGSFSSAVAAEYERTYGVKPLKRIVHDGSVTIRVNAYLKADLPVIERAFARSLGEASCAR